jgi:hypothetical protein
MNIPVPADVESYLPVDTTGIYPSAGGAGQTWNYTNIVTTSTAASSATYVPISSVPNASLFPGSTIGSHSGGSSYSVFDCSSSWTYMGSATSNTMFCTVYGDPATYYSYPFSFGSTSSDTYSFATQFDTTSGSISTVGDATGMLQLPTISYNNVLRVKRTMNEVNVGASPYTFTGETWFFYSAATKFPHMVMVSYTVNSGSGTFSNRSISVNVPVTTTGLLDTTDESTFNIYPNPAASGQINIDTRESMTGNIVIFNSLGQEIKCFCSEAGQKTISIDAQDLPKGIYFVRTDSGAPSKFVIQ